MKHAVIALVAICTATGLFAQVPSVDDVIKRARDSVARDEQQTALLIADEQCDEKAFEGSQEKSNDHYAFGGTAVRIDPKGRRKWQAELAIIRTPEMAAAGNPWMEIRNVVAVDGQPLADRRGQLSRLFLEQPEWSVQAASEIATESARFKAGTLRRPVSTPVMPLLVLHPANAARFAFDKTGEEVVDRVKTWKVDYREQLAPTLFSSGGGYCPASGTFWIDPTTGEIVRALLQCVPMQDQESVDRITVTYRRDPKLGIRVPVDMLERPEATSPKTSWLGEGRVWVEGKCTYSNYRRFETSGRMINPK